MSKAIKATLTSDVVTSTAPATAPAEAEASTATLDIRPNFITISDFSYKALPAAVALIRMGWSLSADYPPTVFENTGYATITLDRKKIDPKITELANHLAQQEETLAAERAAIDHERQVQEAAKAIVAKQQKDAEAAKLAVQIAEQRATLQALEQAAAAA